MARLHAGRGGRLIKPERLLPLRERYILQHLLLGLAALTGGATALIWLTQSLHFIGMIVQHGLSLPAFLHLTLLMLPSFITVILPVTCFLVILWVYQRLDSDRELTILQATGLSPLRLACPGLLCAGFATLTAYGLSLWGAPLAYHHFHRYELEIRNRAAAFLLEEGVFTPISKAMTVYVRERRSDDSFGGIMIEDNRVPTNPVTILAEDGLAEPHGNTLRLILHNGSRQTLNRRTGELSTLLFQLETLDFGSPHDQALSPDVAELTMSQLFHPQGDLSPHARNKLLIEGWTRLTGPLACLSYGMIGLLCVLRGRFSRHGNIIRPTVAILSVVGLMILSLMLKNLAERDPSLVPLLWTEVLLPITLGGGLLLWDATRRYRLSAAPVPSPASR
ncbi:LptF/LptG family permease [Bombella sp. ESL0380]|uniref:LptF/LptG family permease n=1 Tax=Acetobacteraceae TaxID=433 RepID=UPI001319B7C3|nr:LptF/LptG family permease [Parasaccharibacter sp. TMW 2.1884]MCL1512344.1 LptF/LptG family permease [Parasaccharibacter sp. TMW 2.1884]MUG79765.1 LptF/LptG family permease [Bombella sp. ESL0380]QGT75384.1 LptF/LptG family permease [Bombella sp. ESL0368]